MMVVAAREAPHSSHEPSMNVLVSELNNRKFRAELENLWSICKDWRKIAKRISEAHDMAR